MHKPLSYAALLLASQFPLQALADTDVYLTNNGPEPLQLTIHQSGSGELQAGSQWTQHRTELGPWESAMVLSFNRYEGVKAGKSYLFETRVTTAGGDTYRLNQLMEGTWWNSTLQHGGETPADGSGWQSDRAIHRLAGPQELAFAAKFTGRYDDLHYMLTPPQRREQPEPAEDKLKVASYNVWALPVIAASIGERLTLLPEYLKGYDALLLQEVFDGRREGFLQALTKEYPYQTRVLDKPGVNIHDGGVVIVSRYPIVREAQLVYPQCTGTDCFADKGVMYAEVIKGGKAWHLFATHTASFDTDEARRDGCARSSSARCAPWPPASRSRPATPSSTAVTSTSTSASSPTTTPVCWRTSTPMSRPMAATPRPPSIPGSIPTPAGPSRAVPTSSTSTIWW